MEYKIYDKDTIIEFGRFKGWKFVDLFSVNWDTDEVYKERLEYAKWFVKEIDNIIIHQDLELFHDVEISEILSTRTLDYVDEVVKNKGKVYWDTGNYRVYKDDGDYYSDVDDIWSDVEHDDLLDDMFNNLDF